MFSEDINKKNISKPKKKIMFNINFHASTISSQA